MVQFPGSTIDSWLKGWNTACKKMKSLENESIEWWTAQGQSLLVRATGEGVMIDGASIVKTDIKASNGVIHVIDSVILPDFRKDIVDTAVEAGSFSTLVAAVKAAVEAGTRGAEKVGEVVSIHVIPRPHQNVDAVLPLGRQGATE